MGSVRDWGSTPEERQQGLPCDSHLERADLTLHRAVTIDAPPGTVFRWLCQLRVAPYSYDWLDNGGRRSPQTLDPELQRLEIGQRVMRIFTLVEFTPGVDLTILLDDERGERLFGRLAGTYRVTPRGSASRLVVRLLVSRPRGTFRFLAPLLPIGDLVMMRRQLLNLKGLAESSARRGD